jgi:hypothetical protein
VRADYELPRVRVFVPLGGAAERTVTRAGVHRRLLVTCVVREHLAGRPWIEVVKVIPTRASIPEGSLLHAIRAEGFIERGSFALAAAELERALAAPLPAHAVASLEHRRRACEARAQKKRPAPAPEK